MNQSKLERGFRFWRDEIEKNRIFDREVAYVPVIALVGIYATFNSDASKFNSYNWRRSVLQNNDAVAGLRHSLTGYALQQIGDAGEQEIDPETIHDRHVLTSINNGIDKQQSSVPANELFLATTLGHVRGYGHVSLSPFRLYDRGAHVFEAHYPKTAAFVMGES